MADNNLFDRVNLRPISKQVAEDLTHKTNEIKQKLTLNFEKNKINQERYNYLFLFNLIKYQN